MAPASATGSACVGLHECHGYHGHKACLYNNVHVYLSPLRNVFPVNVNDSMVIRDSMSLGDIGVANDLAKW